LRFLFDCSMMNPNKKRLVSKWIRSDTRE